jgi:hypothetical protein
MYFLRCLGCWFRNAGHDYGEWHYEMGPNGYHIQCRVCRNCGWVQMPMRESEG